MEFVFGLKLKVLARAAGDVKVEHAVPQRDAKAEPEDRGKPPAHGYLPR
jgi:hypothetical protein